jgi:hypothetical protein
MDTKRSSFLLVHLFNTDLSSNKSTFKTLFSSIVNTGNNVNLVVNSLNKLGNDIIKIKGDMYNLINRSSNNSFFRNTVLIGANNTNESNLVNKDNILYLLVSGIPKQKIASDRFEEVDIKSLDQLDMYIQAHRNSDQFKEVDIKTLLDQLDMYIQAHRNNILMGLEEVLKNTTGNFSIVLYEAPANNIYLFNSNRTSYVHIDDQSIFISSDNIPSTEYQLNSSSNIENRTVYTIKIDGRFAFKQIYIDDPISINNKYVLTCNYDGGIESFILPYLVNELYHPIKININDYNCIGEDEFTLLTESFNIDTFNIVNAPLLKEHLLNPLFHQFKVNYIDYTNDLDEIDLYTHLTRFNKGSTYTPVFKNLQSEEILLLGLYLNIPFMKFKSKCEHFHRDTFGNYTLCGECDECKELYTRFAKLGFTLENMPIRFNNQTELDKLKVKGIKNNALLDNEKYLALRSKLVEVFPYDNR